MSRVTNEKDAAFYLAENLVGTEFEDLSSEDVNITKKCILDTLGCLAAGSAEPPFKRLVAYLEEEGGKEESTIMIYGGKVPARSAVLANSSMARALDLDEVHEKATLHSCVSVIPAAFAIAERQGIEQGKDLITAIALGFDLMCRLCFACKTNPTYRGRAGSYIFGTFGAAAVAAKLLRLDMNGTVSALGNAYCRATGDTACYNDGVLSQRVHQGLAASAGILAAILAQNGVEGSRNVLQGPSGYYAVYENGEYIPEALTDKLGKLFWGTTTSFKPYATSKGIHIPMEATLSIVIENDIKPEEIERIVVRYPLEFQGGFSNVGYFKAERADPKGATEPHFSVPWAIGTIVVKRKAEIQDFTEEGVRKNRELIVPIARKVVGRADPDLQRITGSVGPMIVEILTKDGKTHAKKLDYCKGSPQNPFTWPEMAQRFRDFTSRAAKPLPSHHVEQVIDLVRNLERSDKVTDIVKLLT